MPTKGDAVKLAAQNKKAYHDYFVEETYEAGIVLTGTEIKSVRKGHVQLQDSYIDFIKDEAFVVGMNIAVYDHGNIFNHEEKRNRKLLLHRYEIRKLAKAVQVKGYTVVPLKMYLKDGLCKMEIGLAKGKDLYDKRQSLKERDIKLIKEKIEI